MNLKVMQKLAGVMGVLTGTLLAASISQGHSQLNPTNIDPRFKMQSLKSDWTRYCLGSCVKQGLICGLLSRASTTTTPSFCL